MVIMTLCPNCRTIQKAGHPCPLCKCPVRQRRDEKPGDPRPPTEPRELEPAAA